MAKQRKTTSAPSPSLRNSDPAKPVPQRADAKSANLSSALRTTNRARPLIATIGFGLVTVFGAWYGAGLKMSQEAKEEKSKWEETAPETKLEQLRMNRAKLVTTRKELESKIETVRQRRLAGEGRQEDGSRITDNG